MLGGHCTSECVVFAAHRLFIPPPACVRGLSLLVESVTCMVAACMRVWGHKLPPGRCSLSTLSSQPLWPTEIIILPTSQNNKSTYFPTKRYSQPPLQPYEAIDGSSSQYNAIRSAWELPETAVQGANMALSLPRAWLKWLRLKFHSGPGGGEQAWA